VNRRYTMIRFLLALIIVSLLGCVDPTGPSKDPCAAVPWIVDEATGVQYKDCSGQVVRRSNNG